MGECIWTQKCLTEKEREKYVLRVYIVGFKGIYIWVSVYGLRIA
jgi:hypothetical protein